MHDQKFEKNGQEKHEISGISIFDRGFVFQGGCLKMPDSIFDRGFSMTDL